MGGFTLIQPLAGTSYGLTTAMPRFPFARAIDLAGVRVPS